MTTPNLAFLPQVLQRSANVVGGEVMWPFADAEAAVNALAAANKVVLGLDLRSGGQVGLATEVPWSSHEPNPGALAVESARRDAVEALGRPDLEELASEGYAFVLITWMDAQDT